jgi:hypothetical protein
MNSDFRRLLTNTTLVCTVLLPLAVPAGVFIYAGPYNIGVGAPHSRRG